MDPTGSDEVKKKIEDVKKICKQEKGESTRSMLAITRYKNHIKYFQILHFLLILLKTFAKLSSNYLGN